MPDDPLEFLPGYVSPLTDKEHATIGRIALLWGQVEHFVDQLLPTVSGLSREQLEALQVTEKPIAQRIAFLKASGRRLANAKFGEQVAAFCAILDDCKRERNHIFHGMWGWRADKRSERVIASARKESELHNPLHHSKLPALEKKLCKASRLGFDLFATHVVRQSVRLHPSRFLHHGVQAAPPQWFQQWSERNPWDSRNPGYIEIAGQLPRRSELFPEQ